MLKNLALGFCCGASVGSIFVAGDVGRRLNALEDRMAKAEANSRDNRNFIRICLDSINELANPGGSITEENTVPEVRK